MLIKHIILVMIIRTCHYYVVHHFHDCGDELVCVNYIKVLFATINHTIASLVILIGCYSCRPHLLGVV